MGSDVVLLKLALWLPGGGRSTQVCSEREEGKTGGEEWKKAWSCGKRRCIAVKPTNNSAPTWFLSVQLWSISEGPPPTRLPSTWRDVTAEEPPDGRTRLGPVPGALGGARSRGQLCASREGWDFSPEGTAHRRVCLPHCCSWTAVSPGL